MAKKKSEAPPKLTEEQELFKEAKEKFDACVDWESTARSRGLEDLKFFYADSENGWQWPSEVRKNRDVEKRPVLTINKTRQYCLAIINDAKQNKAQIKTTPVGDKASYEGSQVMQGIARYIEYQSNAQIAYDKATETQVAMGVGYWRVVTEYSDPNSFDQDIFIRRVKDPFSVYLDPDAQEADCSDMNFAFIYTDLPRDRFNVQYPKYKKVVGSSEIAGITEWVDDKHVRLCEYWRRKETADKLISMISPTTGQQAMVRASTVENKELLKQVLDDPTTQSREVIDHTVEWFKFAGDKIIERGTWAGTTIPIIKIIGEESVIDKKMDRKGHVRNLKDPGRIYNYWSSSAVEFVALQSKVPWIAPAEAIEGYMEYWRTANTENHSVLPYNFLAEDGTTTIPPPQRMAPPEMPQAYIQGLQIAAEEMRMASGQYQTEMGEPSNERTGVAINARQRMADKATYHFVDNQAIGIRYTGKILIEIIPKIYDTKRVVKILGLDGTESSVLIDPEAQQEYQEEQQKDNDKIQIIFNPSFAKYAVEADVGPAYATRRQEAFNAFVQIMGANPSLVAIAGDLMFRAADFPLADELAERLKNMVPYQALGKAPPPEMQQLQQQNQQLMDSMEALVSTYAEERVKWMGVKENKDIDAFRAETDRAKILLDKFDPQMIAQMTAQLMMEMMGTDLTKIVHSPVVPEGLGTHTPQPLDSGASIPAELGGNGAQPPANGS